MGDCNLLVDGPKQAVATFALSGGYLWAKRVGSPGTRAAGLKVAVTSSGTSVVAGFCAGTTDFGGGPTLNFGLSDICVASYTPDGTLLWTMRAGGPGTDRAQAVAVDSIGDVLLTGTFEQTATFGGLMVTATGAADMFVAKLAGVDGSPLWVRRYGDSGAQAGLGVAVDALGDAYVVGNYTSAIDFGDGNHISSGSDDIFVARLAKDDGTVVWSSAHGGTGSDFARAVALSSAGDVVVVGAFSGTVNLGGINVTSAGAHDVFLVAYSSAGVFQRQQVYGGLGEDMAASVAVDANGIAIAGQYTGPVSFGGSALPDTSSIDAFVAAYTLAGAHRWSTGFGSNTVDVAQAIALGPGGVIEVAGSFRGSVDFGGGARTAAFVDVFVVKYSLTGSWIWDRTFGSGGEDIADSIAIDATGMAIVTGEVEGTVNFGGGSVVAVGVRDLFLTKLRP